MPATTSQNMDKKAKKQSFLLTETERFECGVCMAIMYNASSCYPCLHTFCAGCAGEWLKSHKKCPMCRAPTTDLVQNRDINELVEKFLEQHPERKRSADEKMQLDRAEGEYLSNALIESRDMIDQLFGRTEILFVDLKKTLIEKGLRISNRLIKIKEKEERKIRSDLGSALHAFSIERRGVERFYPISEEDAIAVPVNQHQLNHIQASTAVAPAPTVAPAPVANRNPWPQNPRSNRRRRQRNEVVEAVEEVVPRRSARLRDRETRD